MTTYKITLFGVKETTKIIAEYLHSLGIQVDLIVSIDQSVVDKNDISNYWPLKNTASEIGADYYSVNDYSLHHLDDDFFQKNDFQLGIVYGWQRLIPDDIIGRFKQGLFGFHASPELLPKGRGRSPLNWGIILGKTTLYNHCFRYESLADAGDIYSITPFEITPHDTILTLLYKSLCMAKHDIIRLLDDIHHNALVLTPQRGDSSYFPKRSPDDGLIDFNTSTTADIINLIRGVSEPFSGAFCFKSCGTRITIYEAWPFDSLIDFSKHTPGQVIDNIYHLPIVKTIDGSIIIKRYQGSSLNPPDQFMTHKGK